jgi:helicase
VIAELAHPLGLKKTKPYTVAEYKNIAGRAGRLGLTDAGTAIMLSYGTADEHEKWHRYVTGIPEDITSCLLSEDVDLYTLLLRVVAIASTRIEGGITAKDAVDVLANSFASHQMRLAGADDPFEPSRVDAVLTELHNQGFVDESSEHILTMSSLGQLVARSGITVRSALNITRVARILNHDQLNRATLLTLAQLTEEVDDVLFPINHRGHQAEMLTFARELSRQRTATTAIQGLRYGTSNQVSKPALRAKKAVACLLWMGGVPAARFEPTLMKHMKDRDAVGPVRALTSRTRDVIDTVIAIAQEIHPQAELDALADSIPVQLELGVPAAIVPLATVTGGTLSRQVYLDLVTHNLADVQAIIDARDEDLIQCVGSDPEAVARLRRLAVRASSKDEDAPTLEELLSPPID